MDDEKTIKTTDGTSDGTTVTAEDPQRNEWLESWDEDACDHDTKGNRCPRCGTTYPNHVGIEDTIVYAVADAVEFDCVCTRCGLGFKEIWMWLGRGDMPSETFELRYQGTMVEKPKE